MIGNTVAAEEMRAQTIAVKGKIGATTMVSLAPRTTSEFSHSFKHNQEHSLDYQRVYLYILHQGVDPEDAPSALSIK